MKRHQISLIVAAILCVQAAKAQVSLDSVLPIDPQVRVGHLDNGLTYYIRKNALPEKKVELRLVVNAGSILEDDHQRGLAHFCEHMAFNGTKHFQKNDLVAFLQSIGVQFGADLNANTSFDETEYILPIPTDKPGNLDTGFLILEDWAHNVSYTTQDINEERPVILEESRLGKGAAQRMRDKYFPALFSGSKYADRLPIGIDSIIKTFDPDTLRAFYHDWYRPDLMAVVVVGDVDPDKAEAMIRRHFAGLTNPSPEKPRYYSEVPERMVSQGMVVTDKEATNYNFQLLYPFEKKHPMKTLGDYREDMLKELFRIMLGQRLAELTQKPDPPFLGASAGFTDIARGYETFYGSALVGKDGVPPATDALMEEIDRVAQFGFTEEEMGRARKNLMNSMDQAFQERDKTESGDFVDEYIEHFLEGEAIPGIDNEYRYYRELLPLTTAADVSALTASLKANPHYLVLLTGPEKGNFTLPSDTGLLALANRAASIPVQAYQEKAIASDLLPKKPQPGKVIQTTTDPALGTTELVFGNGVRVILKPTDFKNDEILLDGFRKGGKSVYGVADRYDAEYCATAVGQMGIGSFSPTDLKKALAGKTAGVSAQLGELSAEMKGNSSVKDLETMLQLVYLYCTQPRKDTALYHVYLSRQITQLQFLMANPQAAFLDTLGTTLYQGNPLAPILVPHAAYFKGLDLDRMLHIYLEQFGDGRGFTFTLVGSFDPEKIKPLLAEYLGGLPDQGKVFEFRDNGVRPLSNGSTLTVHKGKEKKGLILKFYNTEAKYSEASSLALQALTEVLNIRIINRLREEIGGIYSGGMFGDFSRYPYGNVSLVLQLPCNPDKVDTLLTAFTEELNKIKTQGPTAGDLEKVKAQWKEKHTTDIKENGYWQESLHNIYLLGEDPKASLDYLARIAALTGAEVQEAAKKWALEPTSFTAVQLPEN
jgi:zinc protease